MSDLPTLLDERLDFVRPKVVADPDPPDPRVEYDNAATMACAHRRYCLGDKNGMTQLRDAVRESRSYRPSWEGDGARALDFADPADLAKALARCNDIVWLSLYLFDHSGITMSTAPFCCPWDSGQVGVIFMTRAQILAEYGATVLTAAVKVLARTSMIAEVANYDRYLRGDLWSYVVETNDGEHLDSCWGFAGSEYAIGEGRDAAAAHNRAIAADRARALASEIEASRPDMYANAVAI